MPVYLAPGVYARDVDLSDVVRNQATSIGAVVGQSAKGPAGKRILLTNTKDIVDLLGKPDIKYGYGVHSLVCGLEEMSRCYFYRVVKKGLCSALLIGNEDSPETAPPFTGVPPTDNPPFLSAKNQSIGMGNGVLVTFSGVLSPPPVIALLKLDVGDVEIPVTVNGSNISGNTIASGTLDLNSGAISVTFTDPPDADITVSATFEYSDSENTAFMITAENEGIWGDNLKVQVTPIAWDPESFQIKVYEVIDGLDVFRETFDVSRKQKVDGHGNQMYIEDRINGRSAYIRIHDNYSLHSDIMPSFMPTPIRLSGGSDGEAVTEGDIVNGWQQFRNPAEVDMNILINAGYVSLDSWAVHSSLQGLAEMRRDCFAILDIPSDATKMFPTTDAVTWRVQEQNINSSFTALYSPWILVYDTYNDIRNLPLPPSGFVAQVFARTDYARESWYAPAGYNRGVLVSQTLPPMDVTDRYGVPGIPGLIGELEALYEAPSNINPIIFSPGDGIVVFGQKTQQTKPSALDRINVRRLIITTERACKQFLKYKLFELNNKYTRRDIVSALTQYFQDVQSRNGVYTFKVVCDESNNTPQVIDNNQLNVDIYMQPQKAAEFIQLQSIITRTGVDFRVLVLTGGNF